MIRCQETWAFWTALNNLAAWLVFTASLVKQARKVVKLAMFHTSQPVPWTFFAPNQKIIPMPAMAMASYKGPRAPSKILARALAFS